MLNWNGPMVAFSNADIVLPHALYQVDTLMRLTGEFACLSLIRIYICEQMMLARHQIDALLSESGMSQREVSLAARVFLMSH